jgi:indole-3-glycerol phosphate synthase
LPEAQVAVSWVPPKGPLGELTERSRLRARESELARAELVAVFASVPEAPDFAAALAGERVAVIAELKRSSPSKGAIAPSLDTALRTRAYAAGGAAALSILTESSRFGGSLADLRDAKSAVNIPLLRKDFITSEIQILEARVFGASAVLLIARALAPTELRDLAQATVGYGLTPLIEIRDEGELARAVQVEQAVIGVNNRDLETLVIEPEVGARMIPLIPRGRIAIYESGVADVHAVERAAALGADAVLVGSALSVSPDGAAAVAALASVRRLDRRG